MEVEGEGRVMLWSWRLDEGFEVRMRKNGGGMTKRKGKFV